MVEICSTVFHFLKFCLKERSKDSCFYIFSSFFCCALNANICVHVHASIFWQVIICRCKIIQVGLILFGFLVVPGSTLTYQIVFLGHLGSSLDDKLTMHTFCGFPSARRPSFINGRIFNKVSTNY